MSEETKDQEQAGAEATQAVETVEQQPAEPRKEPIRIELEDLTEEGRKKIEESLKRPVADIPATVLSQDKHPGSLVRLNFQVARADYDAEQGRLLKDLAKEAVLPGYRRGKVPVKLLQIRLGEDAVRDTVRSLATNAMRQEVARQQLKLTVRPQVTEYNVADDAVTFEVEAEVEPTVEAKEYTGITVEVEMQPVAEEAVNQRIEAMRNQNAVYENAPEDAVVQDQDVLTVDAEVYGAQGQKLENMSREAWHLYAFREQLPPAVADLIVGKKVGEQFETKVENKSTNRRGEEVTHMDDWKVTVKEIKRSRLPELDDEFAKDLGDYATLEDLKNKIRAELQEAEETRQRNEALGKIYQKLSELNPIDVPHSLLNAQTYQLIRQDQEQLQRYGMRLEHVIHDPNQYLNDQRNSAGQMVLIGLLLDEIAKKENLAVTDEDVDKEIEKMAERQGRKPLAVRARLEAQRQLDQFREQVGRQKINDFLLANATVNKVPAKPKEEAPAADAETKE